MKIRHSIILTVLLLAAGLLGWFLPVLVAEGGDRAAEGRTEAVSLRQVDLTYESDLDTADRLRLVQDVYMSNAQATRLERGIFLDEAQVREILEQFLLDLTDRPYRLTTRDCTAVPILLSFPEEGSFLAWEAAVVLDDGWYWEVILDDETGLILRSTLQGEAREPPLWDSLIPGIDGEDDLENYLYAALRDAVCSHWSARLSVPFTARVSPGRNSDVTYGDILLFRDGEEAFRLPFIIITAHGYLALSE